MCVCVCIYLCVCIYVCVYTYWHTYADTWHFLSLSLSLFSLSLSLYIYIYTRLSINKYWEILLKKTKCVFLNAFHICKQCMVWNWLIDFKNDLAKIFLFRIFKMAVGQTDYLNRGLLSYFWWLRIANHVNVAQEYIMRTEKIP